jgi:hypothetical protein
MANVDLSPLSVLSFPTSLSNTSFLFPIKLERIGITRKLSRSVSSPCHGLSFLRYRHYSNQYCDGLRGPMVIYDPHDPQAHLYDVDDGMSFVLLTEVLSATQLSTLS